MAELQSYETAVSMIPASLQSTLKIGCSARRFNVLEADRPQTRGLSLERISANDPTADIRYRRVQMLV